MWLLSIFLILSKTRITALLNFTIKANLGILRL